MPVSETTTQGGKLTAYILRGLKRADSFNKDETVEQRQARIIYALNHAFEAYCEDKDWQVVSLAAFLNG